MNISSRLRRLRHSERGTLSAWMLLTVAVIIAVVGFVIDSSGKYQADAQAQQTANNAARAAVNSISGDSVYTGSLDIDAGKAETTAHQYLSAAGASGTVTVSGQTVNVTITASYATKFLSIVGVNSLPVHAHASAQLLTQQ